MHQSRRDPDSSKPLTAIGSPSTIVQANEVLPKACPLRKDPRTLKLEDEILRSIFVSSPDAITITDLNGKIVECNQATLDLHGYPSKTEVIDKNALEFIVKKDHARALENLKKTSAQGSVKNVEYTFVAKDGREFPAELSASVVRDSSGKPINFVAITKDITQRKQAEEQAKRLQEYLQLQIDRMPIGLIVWTSEFRVKAWNPAAENIFGFTAEEAMGKHPYDIIVPREAQPHVDDIWRRLFEGDMTAHSLNENVTKYGRTIICQWSNTPLRKADGTIIGVLSMVQDITERKRMEDQLRRHSEHLEELVEEKAGKLVESEKRFRELADLLPQIVFEVDLNGNITYANHAGFESIGYTEDDLRRGLNIQTVASPEDRGRSMEDMRRILSGEKLPGIEYTARRRDGTTFPLLIYASPIIREGKPAGLRGIGIDITERKLMEEELKQRNEDIKVLNEGITQRLLQKISQIDNISGLKDRLRKSPDVSTGLDLIFDTALNDLEMDLGAVLLIDHEKSAVKLQGFKSKIEDMKLDESYPLHVGFAELKVLKENKNLSEIVREDELSILKTTSIHCAPILGKQGYGILMLGSRKALTLNNSDLAILGLYAELASTLFETQSLTITPVKEVVKGVQRRFDLESGSSYLVKNSVEKAFEVFADNVLGGLEGLCITREFPPKVRRKYGLEKTPIVWLTSQRAEGEATVHSLQDLSILIANFLEKAKRAVVLLDGLEYLITNHGFEISIRFLQTSRSRFQQKDGILIAPLLEKAVDAREVALIEREMKPLITK